MAVVFKPGQDLLVASLKFEDGLVAKFYLAEEVVGAGVDDPDVASGETDEDQSGFEGSETVADAGDEGGVQEADCFVHGFLGAVGVGFGVDPDFLWAFLVFELEVVDFPEDIVVLRSSHKLQILQTQIPSRFLNHKGHLRPTQTLRILL